MNYFWKKRQKYLQIWKNICIFANDFGGEWIHLIYNRDKNIYNRNKTTN